MAYKKLDELAAASGESHIALTEAQIAKLFRSADKDKSGELNFEEFSEILDFGEFEDLSLRFSYGARPPLLFRISFRV